MRTIELTHEEFDALNVALRPEHRFIDRDDLEKGCRNLVLIVPEWEQVVKFVQCKEYGYGS